MFNVSQRSSTAKQNVLNFFINQCIYEKTYLDRSRTAVLEIRMSHKSMYQFKISQYQGIITQNYYSNTSKSIMQNSSDILELSLKLVTFRKDF